MDFGLLLQQVDDIAQRDLGLSVVRPDRLAVTMLMTEASSLLIR